MWGEMSSVYRSLFRDARGSEKREKNLPRVGRGWGRGVKARLLMFLLFSSALRAMFAVYTKPELYTHFSPHRPLRFSLFSQYSTSQIRSPFSVNAERRRRRFCGREGRAEV